MDAAQALADLTEISSQIVHVAIIDGDGSVLATTIAEPDRAAKLAEGVARMLEEAARAGESRGLAGLTQLEAATLEGSVFIVRRGARVIAATTRPDPTVGLVFYDLKHCLKSVEEEAQKPAPRLSSSTRGRKADATP